MKPNYKVHEDMYVQARQAGWAGWGGSERISKAVLVERFLALGSRPKQGKLLELGCGEGHHCRAFFQLGFDVTGVDISPTAISWANEKSEALGITGKYYVVDVTDESLELSEQYDVVIDGNCLHCIIGNDRTTVLTHVYNLLSKNGSFFVSSLCSKNNNSYETNRDGYLYRHVASQDSLVVELEQAGFQVIKANVYEHENSNHITIHAVKS